MSRLSALTAALTAAALTVLTAFPLAQADPGRYAPTMLVLDASGSMERPDQGATMMDSAKRAVRAFVASAPDDSAVGLATYGTGTANSEADKAAGCHDVQVLRQPTTLDRPALTAAVDGIHPRGWTPIGAALRLAADALPDSGPRSIVLVSDGDDTCSPPDPCEVARELEQQGIDLIVHSIGFAVDDKARAQLTCVAQATGGTYSDAADGAALERVLPRVSSAALRNYQATGTPITGTDEYRTAPLARPGQYLDTIGQRQKRFYAVDVPEGATAYFTGIVSSPRTDGVAMTEDMNALELRVYGRDGVDCAVRERELETRAGDGVALTVAKAFEGAAEEPTSADSTHCKGGGRYYFEIDWDLVAKGSPARLPLEILVGIEPGVTDPGPAAVSNPATFTDPAGPARPISGGGSFTAATTLPGTGNYTDTLQSGEYVFYRVRLDWGQGLAYRVRYAETGGANSTAASNVETTLFSPLGREIDADTAAYTGRSSAELTLASVPVRYANRDHSDSRVQRQAVAGWHYIAVKLGIPMGADAMPPTPIQLDVTVSGAAEPGPTYVGAGAAPEAEQTAAVRGPATVDRPWVLYVLIGASVTLVVGIGIAIAVVARRRE
ncbi:vWA domain-containing protein [Nocardia alba]|uniref:Ca-activated chloride channel family protein n=1 Tax=Nocardia alba TaxID=225051 RepID=A0A4R1FFF3_9NOCA|nr:VWA domain-containing protein [Nocardia alba]TCJ93477.1 Ca-activated chloride channel family protein [Nocardia alba]